LPAVRRRLRLPGPRPPHLYTGLLLAMLGTALTTNFRSQYPAYQASTKMLIPFIL
jgi:hypothetical protein